MNVADALFNVLSKEAVSHIFCVPGQPIDALLESATSRGSVIPIVAAHEAGAVYMADGYSRASSRFGACLCIGGPGITNTMTALATALADRSPLLVATGDTQRQNKHLGALQDLACIDTCASAVVAPVTTARLTLEAPEQTLRYLRTLLQRMLAPASRGPVQLTIPMDLQKALVHETWTPLNATDFHPRPLDETGCQRFWRTVGPRPRIAILAGSGCIQSDASEELLRFAERFHIPVATTLGAKGVFPEDHPLSLGVLGWFGNGLAIQALTGNVLDTLVVLGSRLNMLSSLGWAPGLQPAHALIVNDINADVLCSAYRVDLSINGDTAAFLTTLNRCSQEDGSSLQASLADRKRWLETLTRSHPRHEAVNNTVTSLQPIHPARVVHDLQQVMGADTLLFSDSGAHAFFVGHYWKSLRPRRFFTSIKYMGAMGWAIPAAIGAAFACPGEPCVVVTGDGCMLMHGIEIQTAARHGLPLICVVMNNAALGNPKLRADAVNPALGKLHELPLHDWAGFATALGATGLTVTDAEQLVPTFKYALGCGGTVVIDVRTGNYPTPTTAFDLSMKLRGVAAREPR